MKSPSKGSVTLCAVTLIVLTACRTCSASASDFWITQNGAGSADGSSLGNAASCGGSGLSACSAFNNPSNWGSGSSQIGPGTTIHVSGTITAAANACNYLAFQAGGSNGNPITLLMDSTTVLAAPTWGSGCYAIYSTGNSYLTINGGATGSATGSFSGGGTIQATQNGTGLTYQTLGNGIGIYGGSNYLVENLTIANIYVHTCTLPVSNCTDEGGDPTGAVYFQGASNVTVNNIVAHDMKWALELQYVNGNNNITFSNNMLYNVDHGVAIGTGGQGAVIANIFVYGNYYHDPQNWDDNSAQNHHDGVHEWAPGSGTCINNTAIYNNYFYGNFGVNMNDAIYQENFVSCNGNYIFNNVVAPSGGSCGNGLVGLGANSSGSGGGWLVANNTIAEYSNSTCTGINANATEGTAYNNIVSTIYSAIGGYTINGTAIDYQDYYNIGNGGWNGGSPLSAWVSYCQATFTGMGGCDAHSISSSPNLTAAFVPNAGSPVIAAGANLFGRCNGQANPGLGALCSDAAGNPRPSSGAWTIGAYNYSSGTNPGTPISSIAPPTQLVISAQ